MELGGDEDTWAEGDRGGWQTGGGLETKEQRPNRPAGSTQHWQFLVNPASWHSLAVSGSFTQPLTEKYALQCTQCSKPTVFTPES